MQPLSSGISTVGLSFTRAHANSFPLLHLISSHPQVLFLGKAAQSEYMYVNMLTICIRKVFTKRQEEFAFLYEYVHIVVS